MITPEIERALHESVAQVVAQANRIDNGSLGAINLAVRYDSRVGTHVHASGTVRQRIFVTTHTELPKEKKM